MIGPLREALADPAPKHLVIVHLIGAHPHYRLRAPEDYPEVWTPDNPIEQRLEEKGRSFLTIETREDYDRTMRYHDHILAETLKLTAARSGPVTWFYLSDHGQEIGDLADRTGHAANLPSGYHSGFALGASCGRPQGRVGELPHRLDGSLFARPRRN